MNNDQKQQLNDLITSLHWFATSISIENPKEGFAVRLLADDLAKIGNTLYEKNTV